MIYISVEDAAKKWNVSERSVELLRYRQNSWDNSCRKDLENPGNSGKAKTQERKNKKRPAVCSAGGKRKQRKGGIYHKVQIDLTYNSNHIEEVA